MNASNKSRKLTGLSLLLIGAFIFVAFGFYLERTSPNGACDFETLYYPARFLVSHEDPYLRTANYHQLEATGYLNPNSGTPAANLTIFCVYPPTALLVTAPVALLRWHNADLVWIALLAGSIITAALLVWSAAAENAPILAGMLIGFTLANSISLLLQANAAGLAVGLAVIAVVLFVRQRLEFVGVLCLTIGICLKPHDGVFLWLFLLFAGTTFRTPALRTLWALILLGVPAILWVSTVSPNWRQELTTNIALLSAKGSINDPGPGSSTNQITNAAVNLQTAFAVFSDRPAFYNTGSYIISAALFIWLAVTAFRRGGSPRGLWFGIAAVSALTMLPVYHRHHDARMLLLAIPACTVLWAENRAMGWLATSITSFAIAATGDIPRALLQNIENGHTFPSTFFGKLQMVIFARPAPLALLLMAVFFLYVFARSGHRPVPETTLSGSNEKSAQLT